MCANSSLASVHRYSLTKLIVPRVAKKLYTFPLISHLMPERNRIANALLVAKDLQSNEGQAVLRDLYSLCNDETEWHIDQINGLLMEYALATTV